MSNQKPKNFNIILGLIFTLSLSLGIIIGIFVEHSFPILPKSDNEKLDDAFQILDKTAIHTAGNMEIDSIINRTSSFGEDPKRLALIAEMITNDFTDPNWGYQRNENYFCYYPKVNYYNYCCLLGQNDVNSTELSLINCTYMVDKKGRVRQYNVEYSNGIVLSKDPYWIAYQKTGECQELSILFNDIANKAGFETRIIRSDGINHFWNEVNISGDWKYFDVQNYGDAKGSGNSSNWFGNTSDYANLFSLCDMINKGKTPGIFVYVPAGDGYGEKRNEAYDPRNSCS